MSIQIKLGNLMEYLLYNLLKRFRLTPVRLEEFFPRDRRRLFTSSDQSMLRSRCVAMTTDLNGLRRRSVIEGRAIKVGNGHGGRCGIADRIDDVWGHRAPPGG